ncbi:hypothetical protein V8E51_004188 [Hyaloscypha variabilis]
MLQQCPSPASENTNPTLHELSKAFSRFDTRACTLAATSASPDSSPTKHTPTARSHTPFSTHTCYPKKTQIETLLETWSSVLESSFQNHEKGDICTSIGAKILKTQRLAMKIFLGALFYRDQIAYDAFIPTFRQIVDLCSSILDEDDRISGLDGSKGRNSRSS